MADTWLTIEQAAVTLGLSVRTVNRHITAGKLRSRLSEGRREVLVSVPDGVNAPAEASPPSSPFPQPVEKPSSPLVTPPPTDKGQDETPFTVESVTASTTATPSEGGSSDSHVVDPTPRYDRDTVLALFDDRTDLAISAFQTMARTTEADKQAARRAALLAWSAVGVMGVGMLIAVGWTANRLTRAEVEVQYLRNQANATSARADNLASKNEDLSRELLSAREENASVQARAAVLAELQGTAKPMTSGDRPERSQGARAGVDVDIHPTTVPSTLPSGGVSPVGGNPMVASHVEGGRPTTTPATGLSGSATRP